VTYREALAGSEWAFDKDPLISQLPIGYYRGDDFYIEMFIQNRAIMLLKLAELFCDSKQQAVNVLSAGMKDICE
jgi:hypothetical protein